MTFSAADPAAIDLLNAKIEALQARVLGLETILGFIANMEGQEGMTDALFAEKTLALIHALDRGGP